MYKLKKKIIASHIKIKTKMKVKNLLLAGLAAAAITACSNGEEFVDNGIQAPTGEQASMRINFSTPAVTRASSVTPGGADEGSAEESAITTATIVLDYAGSKRIINSNRNSRC